MTPFGILAALIVIPLATAGAVAALPARNAKWVALLGTMAALLAGVASCSQYPWEMSAQPQLTSELEWIPSLGLKFSLGADGVSFALILLTLLLGPVCVACSFTAITDRVKTYYGWLLILQAAMTGVFAAQDLILFYICFEFTLIPMFILISLYGSTNRRARTAGRRRSSSSCTRSRVRSSRWPGLFSWRTRTAGRPAVSGRTTSRL